MLIDDIQNQPVDTVQALGKGTPTDSDLAKERLRLLPSSARYDINNIWQALHCKTERADQLRTLAGKAPAYPRWNEAWLEYNYDGKHRRGILTQWDNEGMQYDCALFTEQNPVVEGTSMRVGIFPGSFKLYVDEEYRVVVPDINSRIPEDRKKECAEIIEAITTTMRVLNWSREIAPTTVIDMSRTNQKRRAAGKRPLSSPTVIRIKPMLDKVRVGRQVGKHESPLYHPVAGHLRYVSPLHPLFGAKPIPGKTCGIIPIEPHFRGNRKKGEKKVASYEVRVDIDVAPESDEGDA
jgi:hypothetical protein